MTPPQFSWGTAEGTPQSLVSRTSRLISDIGATVFPCAAFVEVGMDLLSDSPAMLGSLLERGLGQRYMQEIDRIICDGSGSGEPTGLTAASGATVVPSVNGSGGPITTEDVEALYFSLGKQYRNRGLNACFVASDAGYARLCGIPVGSNDAERIFGMDHGSYTVLDACQNLQLARQQRAALLRGQVPALRRSGMQVLDDGGLDSHDQEHGAFERQGQNGRAAHRRSALAKMTDLPV